MARVKRGVTAHRRHKKIISQAKGYRGRRKNVFRVARQAVIRAACESWRARRARRRDLRSLWIMRINAGARANGLSYSRLMSAMRQHSMEINRKMLAELAVRDSASFSRLVEKARSTPPSTG